MLVTKEFIADVRRLHIIDPYTFDKWIEALESGRYQQGKFHLKRPNENSYCCMGVYCDVHPDIEIQFDKAIHLVTQLVWPSTQNESALARHIGFTNELARDLSQMNDTFNLSFEEIADVLKSCLEPDDIELGKKALDICQRIYIARNVTLDNASVVEKLKEIDALIRSLHNHPN